MEKKGGGFGGGITVFLQKLCIFVNIFSQSLFVMDFQQVIEAILILLGIREIREYRKERKNNDNSRKDAENGKNHGSTR